MSNTLHSHLWALTRGYRHRFAAAVAAMALASLLLLSVPLIAKYALDVVMEDGLASGIPLLATMAAALTPEHPLLGYLSLSGVLVVLVTLGAGVFHYFRGRLTATASEALIRRLRTGVHAHVEHLPAVWHDRMDTGDVVQRCSSDVETLRVFFSGDLVEIGRALILVAVLLPLMFWLDWALALVAVALMPVIFACAWVFFRRVQFVFKATDEAEAELTACLQENLTGIRVVRAFSRQPFEMERFGGYNAAFRNRYQRLISLMAVFWSGSDLLCSAQIGLVLIVGGSFVADGRLTVGDLFAFLTWVAMVIWPVRQLGRILTDAGKASVSLVRLAEVLDAAVEEQVRSGSPDTPPARPASAGAAPVAGRGAIEARGLTFAYPGGSPVLQNLSFRVNPGQTLGIVGPPGSGKSTLVRLLLGFYDPPPGTLLIDDVPIERVDRASLRDQLAVVLQEPFLYSRSLEENLRIGREDADPALLTTSMDDAALTETVAAFPEGLATRIGERGVNLSGGQRQRLALARALLRRPAVLILDDSLSAVDAHTEVHVLERLARRRGRQTTLIVAHRLSAVRDADQILVLGEGRLLQQGRHHELAAAAGPYRELCRQQGLLDDDDDEDVTVWRVGDED
ncbi:MAG: ABC transporter ATP-binding protein [Gammaproteobacteria bacterium]|nr:ABC transporter ATP-binding protein [Gammaproteobacteria bacterium]